jgi:hypothetical protein
VSTANQNSIRPSAIGKKNWLFMGDAKSGDRAATFYTLIGNCHREGINAEAYLTDILTRLPSATTKTVDQLTPHAWANGKSHRPVSNKSRADHNAHLTQPPKSSH